jgi:hypothetical protein
MIFAILALLGVPLWLCAIGILVIVLRNRKLRKRHGNIPVRVKRPGKQRWTRGHAIWVSDVFAWRGSPGVWSEDLVQVMGVTLRNPDTEERKKLRHLGDGFPIATLFIAEGETLEVAAGTEQRSALLGPFGGSEEVPPASHHPEKRTT